METKTYSPCRTIISSISTFLFEALARGADRRRFVDIISGAGGVAFIFKVDDFLPTEATKNNIESKNP